MSERAKPTGLVFTVQAGSDGEALVTAPDGHMEFMGVWRFFWFCISATRDGHKIEVQDD